MAEKKVPEGGPASIRAPGGGTVSTASSTAVHRPTIDLGSSLLGGFSRVLRSPSDEPRGEGWRALGRWYIRAAGSVLLPLVVPSSPSTAPTGVAGPCPRDHRPRRHLATHPHRAAADGHRPHLSPLARAPAAPGGRRRPPPRRRPGRDPVLGRLALRPRPRVLRRGRPRAGRHRQRRP